ncbi:Integrase core domain protein [Microbacterium laevaniformans]|uniref:Integrase core domain protein n=1 Tax=Microbacterium laevaniformans TaxID=36807 RepID=A0A150HE13_9MICO|nr:Integrase core domain protein [Microbacterium laevaniformans]
MDLWFPEPRIPVGFGQAAMLPVLVMTLTFSKFLAAVMLPSRQGGDLTAGMWQLIAQVGAVSKTLVWDRESAIGGKGKVTQLAAAFAGTLTTRVVLAPPADPEFKGMTERNNGFFETSFLPGRRFVSPADFNSQLQDWLPRANARTVRSLGGRPIDVLDRDLAAMTALPPHPPTTGLQARVRLGRDYYVRVDGNDYSVDPRMIGRLVDVTATLTRVIVVCDGTAVADHERSWATGGVVTDPAHVVIAKGLRSQYSAAKRDRARAELASPERRVMFRDPGVYDDLFGVRFDPITGEVL